MTPQPEAQRPLDDNLPARRDGHRSRWKGGAVAFVLVASLGALAWYVTRPAVPVSAGGVAGPVQGGPGGPGGSSGPGGFGGGRGGAASTVGVATAERTSIPILLDALGTVTPQATVRVRPQVSGVLEKVLFKEGQMVRAGQLLATIDARQFELALTQAVGQRQRDEAQMESAKVTLQRYKTLLDQDSIARQDVDTQAALVKQLEGTVVIDKANEGNARLSLGYTRVTAPISGRVGLRAVDVGNVVSSTDANGIVLITQVTPIDVVFAISQDRVSDVLQASGSAMKVTALDRSRSGVLDTGVFASLDNQVDTTTGTVKAKARFENKSLALFPSQFVNVQLRLKTLDNAVVVPVTAVRLGGSGDYVYVLDPATRSVSLRPVTRGPATVDKIVVTAGLKAGEQVITEGADRLKDGSRVTLSGDAPRGGGRRQGASAAQGSAGAASASGGTGAPTGPASAGDTNSAMAPATALSAPHARSLAPAATPAPEPRTPPSERSAAAPRTADRPAAALPVGPSPEQRQRMLSQVKDNPEALERRKKFFEKLDSGDAEALERWQGMQQRMQQGGGQGFGPGAGQGRERPPQ